MLRRYGNTYAFLDILANLIVELEAGFEILKFIFVIHLFRRGLRRVEEVEERFRRLRLFNKSRAICIWKCWEIEGQKLQNTKPTNNILLFLCFLISISFVKSLSSFHLISVPIARSYVKSPL